MNFRSLGWIGVWSLFLVPALSGCAPAVSGRPVVAPVSGKVTYKGQPVEGATVSFIATAKSPRTATGVTNAAGEYTLTTFDTGDGAVIGEHKVAIYKTVPGQAMTNPAQAGDMKAYETAMKSAGKAKVENSIPGKYAKVDDSKLVRQVVQGEKNSFNFDLTD